MARIGRKFAADFYPEPNTGGSNTNGIGGDRVVLDPTLPPAGNHVQTWRQLMSIIHASQVPIYFSPRSTQTGVVVPFQVPAATAQDIADGFANSSGQWLMLHSVLMGLDYADLAFGAIQMNDGVQLFDLAGIENGGAMYCYPDVAGSNKPSLVFTGEPNDHGTDYFYIQGESALYNYGSRAAIDWDKASPAVFRLDLVSSGSILAVGSAPVINMLSANRYVYIIQDGAIGTISDNWLGGAAGTFCFVFSSGGYPMPPPNLPSFLGTSNYFPFSGTARGDAALRAEIFPFGSYVFYNTDTSKANFWDGAAWVLADGTPA